MDAVLDGPVEGQGIRLDDQQALLRQSLSGQLRTDDDAGVRLEGQQGIVDLKIGVGDFFLMLGMTEYEIRKAKKSAEPITDDGERNN